MMADIVLDTIHQPLFVVRRDNNEILFVNKAGCRCFNHPRIGDKIESFLSCLDKNNLQDHLNSSIITTVPIFLKYSGVLSDNDGNKRAKYFQAWLTPLELDRVIVMLTDYSHVPAEFIEDPFLRHHEIVADFIEYAPVPMHSVSQNRVYLWANKTEHDLFGFERGKMLGMHIDDILLNTSNVQAVRNDLRNVENPKVSEVYATFKGPKGEVEVAAYINVKQSEYTGLSWDYTRTILRDDNERRLMEKINLLNHETAIINSMNSFQDRIIRNIMHELRTPAQVFLSMGDDLDASDLDDLQLIKELLGGALNDVLLMTDEVDSIAESHVTQCSLEALLDQVIALAQHSISAGSGILISKTIDKSLSNFVCANHQHFRRAILHMIRLAILFTSKNSMIAVQVSTNRNQNLQLNLSTTLCFSITHTSNFIQKELEHLRNSQINEVNLKSVTASLDIEIGKFDEQSPIGKLDGFGINITKKVASLIGGDFSHQVHDNDLIQMLLCVPMTKVTPIPKTPKRSIQVLSPLPRIPAPTPSYSTNNDLKFFARSPINTNQPTEWSFLPEIVNKRKINTSFRILLVDDTVSVQKVISRSLTKLGHTCVCANNGEDALSKLDSLNEEEMFDAILMDLRMPVMNGLEATAHIRNSSKEYLKRIPIIIISADCTKFIKEEALRIGADAFFDKPVSIDVLVDFLNDLVVEVNAKT